jgi:hypothetical protein
LKSKRNDSASSKLYLETNQTDSDDSEEHANQYFNGNPALFDPEIKLDEHSFVLVDFADLDECKIYG